MVRGKVGRRVRRPRTERWRTRGLRIRKALGMTPDFWLNLQLKYDLEVTGPRPTSALSNRSSMCLRDHIEGNAEQLSQALFRRGGIRKG